MVVNDTYVSKIRREVPLPTQLTGFNEKYERRDTLHYFPLSCDFVLVARSHYSSARAAIIVIIIGPANPVDC